MTVNELLLALSAADCTPRVEGDELAFDREPPADLLAYVSLLQTGLRAALSGRPWFGIDGSGTGFSLGTLFDGALNPADTVPAACTLLIVEGDRSGWDRIQPALRDRLPQAFHKPGEKVKKPYARAKK